MEAVSYMNIKYLKYQDYFKQPERIRIKRKTNETENSKEQNKTRHNSSMPIITQPLNEKEKINITTNIFEPKSPKGCN